MDDFEIITDRNTIISIIKIQKWWKNHYKRRPYKIFEKWIKNHSFKIKEKILNNWLEKQYDKRFAALIILKWWKKYKKRQIIYTFNTFIESRTYCLLKKKKKKISEKGRKLFIKGYNLEFSPIIISRKKRRLDYYTSDELYFKKTN